MTRVSIITVTLNNLTGLRKTVESVAAQDDAAFEHIVIDGDSSDGSRAYLESLSSDRLRWISEKDDGIYDAMNKGIKMASGEYLLFLNAGDVLAGPDVLSKVAPFLGRSVDIVYGNLKFDHNGVLSEGFMPDRIDVNHMMRDTLWHPASFIRRDLFARHGDFDTRFRFCGDYEFFFRTLLVKRATSQHIYVFVAIFDLNGLTSDLKNHPFINGEKMRVHTMYPDVANRVRQRRPGFLSRLTAWFR